MFSSDLHLSLRAGVLALVVLEQEGWQTDQLSFYLGPDPSLWVHRPQHQPHLWTAGWYKGEGPADPKLEDLHDPGQPEDIQEDS